MSAPASLLAVYVRRATRELARLSAAVEAVERGNAAAAPDAIDAARTLGMQVIGIRTSLQSIGIE